MKFITTNKVVRMMDTDALRVDDNLNPGRYRLDFDPNSGFFLTTLPTMPAPAKMYGNRDHLISHIIKAYSQSDRSLGILLSGPKGIGKTLFANHLLANMMAQDRPVVMVTGYAPGIENVLDQLPNDTVVFFDEFEKHFDKKDGEQDQLLSLFDGVSPFKRMYVLTLNNLDYTSSYLLHRPGRFHYHLTFQNPKGSEVEEFLNDFVKDGYKNQIPAVVRYTNLTDVTYDHLRAIASELNTGLPFDQILDIVNVPSQADKYEYTYKVIDENGKVRLINEDQSLHGTETSFDIGTATRPYYEYEIKLAPAYRENDRLYADILNLDELQKNFDKNSDEKVKLNKRIQITRGDNYYRVASIKNLL